MGAVAEDGMLDPFSGVLDLFDDRHAGQSLGVRGGRRRSLDHAESEVQLSMPSTGVRAVTGANLEV